MTGLDLHERMSLRELRKNCPSWAWSAVRSGFGWDYMGRKGAREVRVEPRAVGSGPGDDDFVTRWFVFEHGAGADWISWVLSEERGERTGTTEGKLIVEGSIPGCGHEHTRDSGYGTVVYFTECVRCGAKFSHHTGPDPYIAALEASREGPY